MFNKKNKKDLSALNGLNDTLRCLNIGRTKPRCADDYWCVSCGKCIGCEGGEEYITMEGEHWLCKLCDV